uniref:Chalcone--flavanone isomerase n=1 Tax=Aegilops tauschii subsp. strangulata TaxID=200361 RepID=A0A453PS48_AEGTS
DIQPDSICNKLGSKYATVPVAELKDHPDFYEDLLRENIHMTVRLVVSYNGLSISAVRDAFEKSLGFRLQKMNPNTDYHCLKTFGSYFREDIRIPVGTKIDFRQTCDGQLITEVDGKQIGAVQSKDLCRAFFDMYIGDPPVSVETKQDIAQNVGGLIRRC